MTTTRGESATSGVVRPARPQDARRIAELQIHTWRTAYGGILPASVLAELDEASAVEAWTAAIELPPTPRHHVLVAVEPATDQVVGFAALTPAGDSDADPVTDGEIAILLVDSEHGHLGHGSRLLAACADLLRADELHRAVAWMLAQDDALRNLLTSAGWGADGSHRTLESSDGGDALRQLRLHTDLRED